MSAILIADKLVNFIHTYLTVDEAQGMQVATDAQAKRTTLFNTLENLDPTKEGDPMTPGTAAYVQYHDIDVATFGPSGVHNSIAVIEAGGSDAQAASQQYTSENTQLGALNNVSSGISQMDSSQLQNLSQVVQSFTSTASAMASYGAADSRLFG
jgi:hypothetical protein